MHESFLLWLNKIAFYSLLLYICYITTPIFIPSSIKRILKIEETVLPSGFVSDSQAVLFVIFLCIVFLLNRDEYCEKYDEKHVQQQQNHCRK